MWAIGPFEAGSGGDVAGGLRTRLGGLVHMASGLGITCSLFEGSGRFGGPQVCPEAAVQASRRPQLRHGESGGGASSCPFDSPLSGPEQG